MAGVIVHLAVADSTFERRFIKLFLIIENLERFCKGNIYKKALAEKSELLMDKKRCYQLMANHRSVGIVFFIGT